MAAVRRSSGLPLSEQEASDRRRALEGWGSLFNAVGWSGCAAAETAAQEPTEAERDESLAAVLAKKATGTLFARLSQVRLFHAWASTLGGVETLPIAEPAAYAYTRHLVNAKAPASRADSFRSAVAFLKYTCGMPGADAVLQSGRVTGKA